MQLLNTDSLQVESFSDSEILIYAILFHVWDSPKVEVSLKDIKAGVAIHKPGYLKLQRSSELAAQDGLKYFGLIPVAYSNINSTNNDLQ
jgi:hypothetical protein